MKKLTLVTLATFLLFVFNSCKKNDLPHPDCKLTAIDRGTGNKHAYTYDASGKVTKMHREFVAGPGPALQFEFTFTYNSAGKVIKSDAKLDGAIYGVSNFIYSGGRLLKVNYTLADGSAGVNNFRYNAAGLLIESTDESGTPADSKQYFEYNAQGIMTKRGASDLAGNKFFEIITNPVGVAKSPEQLLLAHGLPYDVLTGMPWQIAEGKEGTTFDSYAPGPPAGGLVLVGTGRITHTILNPKGYIIESTGDDGSSESSITSRYTLMGCN